MLWVLAALFGLLIPSILGEMKDRCKCNSQQLVHLWNMTFMVWCVYDKDHMSAIWLKNTSESDSRTYVVT